MDNEEFESQVIKKLKKLNREDKVKFAWVCAMRALPLLGNSGNFNYWEKKDRQKHLYAIFYALDLTAKNSFDLSISIFTIGDIGGIRDAANSIVNYITIGDVVTAIEAVYSAATTAIRITATCGSATYAAAYPPLKDILLQDIDDIYNKRKLNNDKSIYGDLWDKFQTALKNEGCAYWGRWYETIFQSGFKPDKATLNMRLNVPESIRSRGAAAVADYLTGLEKGAERLNEARIIILGEKGAGKTCLARRLINPDAPMTTETESTAGVDTTLWKLKENNINAHIWDFAGHTITHAAHQFFLSERSLYILVYDGRTEERNRLEYWFDHIKNYGANAPVFIFINKRDQHTPEIPIHSLKEKYSVAGVYTFSIKKDNQDLENFRKEVADFITNNPSWNNQKIPAIYYNVKTELEYLFKQGRERIEYSKFEEIAQKYGVENRTGLLKNLHVLGICLWYDKMPELETLVLNPEWITQGVYKIINWVHEKKKHEIAFSDFRTVFIDNPRYPTIKEDKFLFKLMKQYELAFETKKGQQLIIPHLLHQDRPAELPVFDIGESFMLRYKAEQPLPSDTISRFIVRRNEDIQKVNGEYKVWRYGVVLENGKGDIALVREDDRTISISVKGSDKTAYLDTLRQTLNEIFESYKSDKPEMQYKVSSTKEQSDDLIRQENPLFLSANRLYNLSQENKYHYDDVLGRDIDPRLTVRDYAIRPDTLLDKVSIFIDKSTNIDGDVTITTNEENIDNSTHNTFNFQNCNISLQGNLNDLASSLKRMGNIEDAEIVEEAAEALESVENCQTPEEVKKKGVLNKLKRILEDLADEDSKLHKTVEGIKKGISIAQDIAKEYNKIAQWVGLPPVPKPFLKKSE
ncbi:MAG: hypothetical protein LBU22_13850 [Dysgonamonadaceae bacterium]|jgi:small GTP-binding protein|nr:hypothetical protein [Dysgonamonadaceae bacterium]